MRKLVAEQVQALKAVVEDLERQKVMLQSHVDRLERRASNLIEHRDDPTVLIRVTSGGYQRAFHDSQNPCNFVKNRENFKEVLLSQAVAEGCTPCFACGDLWIHREALKGKA
ncbi:MAG TPA: hypothetical protein VFK71_04275 [Gaiellaceae bacterium]|nr:hypothetical protein [Gaiellaceae bacterium]